MAQTAGVETMCPVAVHHRWSDTMRRYLREVTRLSLSVFDQ